MVTLDFVFYSISCYHCVCLQILVDILQAAASAALAAICANHEENQNKVREANAIEYVLQILYCSQFISVVCWFSLKVTATHEVKITCNLSFISLFLDKK